MKYVFNYIMGFIVATASKTARLIILLVFLSISIYAGSSSKFYKLEHKQLEINEWDLLITAIITVESGGDTLAIGSNNDIGAMQIRPIYVAEANRIMGCEMFNLDDRLSLAKSIEMFNIVQSHHNPTKNIEKAISLHNKGEAYKQRVTNVLYELTGK